MAGQEECDNDDDDDDDHGSALHPASFDTEALNVFWEPSFVIVHH